MSDKVKIEYAGQTLTTRCYMDISDEYYQTIRKEYFNKPSFEEVKKQILKIHNENGVKHDFIDRYYVKDLMSKVTKNHCKWSIEDVLNCKALCGYYIARIKSNPKMFRQNEGIVANIDKCFSLGGKGVASKATNFPLKTADEIIKKYNINDNYYDFSCGWGVRLLSALKNHVNYFGTDPNTELCNRLNNLSNDYKSICCCDSYVEIRGCGSEDFVPEWCNKMGFAFSSPPYYCLEDYKLGKQSWVKGITYEQWLKNYLEPTILNIYTYLIDAGRFLINIKNFENYDLVGDTKHIAESYGFELEDICVLQNVVRRGGAVGWDGKYENRNQDEGIFVFKKA